jgi:hypothetical protein
MAGGYEGCSTMMTGRPSPPGIAEPYFQGMLSLPDQPFSFVLTNLSDVGMINFNILHTPHRVSEVNPGPRFGINKVNELHEDHSYVLEADQRTGRQMVLAGKTRAVVDPTTKVTKQVAVTVDEAEADSGKNTGLSFYLSVVPDRQCSSLVDKFAEGTVWRASFGFVRQRLVIRPSRSDAYRSRQVVGRYRSEILHDLDITGSCLDDDDYIMIQTATAPDSSPPRNEVTNDGFTFVDDYECGGNRQLGSPAHIGKTQAGVLTYGRPIFVRSGCTGKDYDYDKCSEPTVLCMSIWEDMSFSPLPDVTSELKKIVEDTMGHGGKRLIESLNAVYKTESCVIDLESVADTIICSCGHQCINSANVHQELRLCPLCRSPITAFVRADGIVLQ